MFALHNILISDHQAPAILSNIEYHPLFKPFNADNKCYKPTSLHIILDLIIIHPQSNPMK